MKKAPKRLLSVLALAMTGMIMVGCGSTVSNRGSAYTGGWWRSNLRNHWYVVNNDLRDLYQSIDRHIFNYDWDDPYLDD